MLWDLATQPLQHVLETRIVAEIVQKRITRHFRTG